MSRSLSKASLKVLVERLLADGKLVAGPTRIKDGLIQYAELSSSDQLLLEGFIRPANSVKQFVFPRHEKLYGYSIRGRNIELQPLDPPTEEQVIIAARPCDAAALPILDHIFNWDVRDEFYNRRRELTTVVSIACREFDSHCFCTSLGLGPDDPRGSDVLLIPIDDERYEVRAITEKGEKLLVVWNTTSVELGGTSLSGAKGVETSETTPFAVLRGVPPTEAGKAFEGPPKRFDLADLGKFLADGYENPIWQAVGMQCLGCGACAYTCPTCHCFDIVDEGGPSGGFRVRNWDACQFSQFTMHASGHNPRENQGQRQRQRIYHKFQTYPEKFGDLLCTGCGNCTRNCPAGLGVLPVIEKITSQKCS